MAEMTPKERGRTLSETLLSDIEKTADVQVAARWLINNADEQIRQAVQAERETICKVLCKKCAKLGLSQFDDRLRAWVHHTYEAETCEAWAVRARMERHARGEKEGQTDEPLFADVVLPWKEQDPA